jgi:hypothetical protein
VLSFELRFTRLTFVLRLFATKATAHPRIDPQKAAGSLVHSSGSDFFGDTRQRAGRGALTATDD